MRKEPVLVLLLGLAGVVDAILLAVVAFGGITTSQAAAIGAAVTAACALGAAVVRASIDSPATVDAKIVEALRRKPPAVLDDIEQHVERVHLKVAADRVAGGEE